MKKPTIPPGPKGDLIFGSLFDVRKDLLGAALRFQKEFGDVVYVRIANMRNYQLNNPMDIERVLVSEHSNFVKSIYLKDSRDLIGDGIFTSEGERWSNSRRAIQPSFRHERIASYCEIIARCTRAMLDRWVDGDVHDVVSDMKSLTLEIVAASLFKLDLGASSRQVSAALEEALEQFNRRFGLFIIPRWVPTPSKFRYVVALRAMDRIIYEMIANARRSDDPSESLLNGLIAFERADGTRMSDLSIRDEIATFLLAGHETTSLMLTWTLYILMNHRDITNALRDEITCTLRGSPPKLEDFGRMPLLASTIKEAMRLYPPAYCIARDVLNDCEFGGYRIRGGSTIGMYQWVVHRDERFYANPRSFDPSRWTETFSKQLPKCAYFPFGAGPRHCPGGSFAITEATIILAMLLQEVEFTLINGQTIVPAPAITLRTNGPIFSRVNIIRRSD